MMIHNSRKTEMFTVLMLSIVACAKPQLSKGERSDKAQSGKTNPSIEVPATTSKAIEGNDTDFADCSAKGIAAFADRLVVASRKYCNTFGTGVVRRENYTCMQSALNELKPRYQSESFNIVQTLLPDNFEFPFFECTYFVQMVTTAMCGVPISPSDFPWTQYPLAKNFIAKEVSGFRWMPRSDGTAQVGDVLLYDGANEQAPGHIMIVAEELSLGRWRIAEANQLQSDGTEPLPGAGETGVVSNTRIETSSSQKLVGWFRFASVPQPATGHQACNNPCSLYGMAEGECRSGRFESYLCERGCSIVIDRCR